MKTLLHKNLHNGLIAITQRSIVVGYCDSATLLDVDLKHDRKKEHFSQNGGKRTVHLWARGTLVEVQGFVPLKGRDVELSPCDSVPVLCERVRYNPKRDKHMWYESCGTEFTTSEAACVSATAGMTASFD